MRDNQNRDLTKSIEWAAKVAERADAGRALWAEVSENVDRTVDWTTVEGIKVLRAGDSKFVAQPVGSRKFDIIDLDAREFVCQVGKGEVRRWLASMAEEN